MIALAEAEPIQTRRGCDCDYDGLTATFAEACREADRQHSQQQAKALPAGAPRIAESTRQAVDWLLKLNDAERLRSFIRRHPNPEAKALVAYVEASRK